MGVPGSGAPRLVTTSWDDGDPLDLRVAELLSKHELAGTFYVPSRRFPSGRLLTAAQIREIGQAFEIGAHATDDVVLTRLDPEQAEWEMRTSKHDLEDVLGRPVESFAFPRGRYSRQLVDLARRIGFRCVRTAECCEWEWTVNGYVLRPTIQAYPHTAAVYLRKLARQPGRWDPRRYLRVLVEGGDWGQLARRFLGNVRKEGGVWHLWGHSADLEALGLWGTLEELLDAIQGEGGLCTVTNIEVSQRLGRTAGPRGLSCRHD